ncbi:hypothetical protein K443DRAFT_685385 [Laccaria amethystina LaAM-08-1]|uniref:Uncharacterized protein n=1 Tax=Laccaria amethystina LaAM-08-1 TaxID=1095629 RepID=A0A0C9WI33_9AGAR|nr:hypothetical protein K443DRAFT_685385 [Laccaria amethystina LaAM-08-1]
MDLSCPDRVGSGGLETLELVNVFILRGAGETEGVWDWCFRRMMSLVSLIVSNIDASPQKGEAICHPADEFEHYVVKPCFGRIQRSDT